MYAKPEQPVLAELVERPANRSNQFLVVTLLGGGAVLLLLITLFFGLISAAFFTFARPMPRLPVEAESAVLDVTDESFDEVILSAGTSDPILVDFHAD